MFYFTGDILLSFQLKYNDVVITPDDALIYVYLGETVVSSGVPVLVGEYYNYVFTVQDSDILPNFYNSYRFMVTATYETQPVVVNGYFIVHVSDYDNLDNTAVLLSNQNSEIYMQCADQTRTQCLTSPPVKPEIISLDMYKMNSAACDCITKK